MILKEKLEFFEKKINFKFKDKNNLLNALTHPSYIKEKNYDIGVVKCDFERLEFLGDRVLGLIISSLIYDKFSKLNEGDLSKKLSYLVKKEFLYKIALQININEVLKYSYKKENLRMNISILSDAIESLIGGIYLDSGYLAAVKFVKFIWGPYLDIDNSNEQDPKTCLQEISQKNDKTLPEYTLLNKNGPPHSPVFTVSLSVLKFKNIEASGQSIREAEKNAAIEVLRLIND